MLWVGVARNPELVALKRRVDRALAAVGIERRERASSPPTSRSRGCAARSRPSASQTWLMRHSLYRSESFAVSDFHLYSSWLKPWGAEHQLEASYELVPGL